MASLLRAAVAAFLLAVGTILPAHATTISAVPGAWFSFDVDDAVAKSGGVEWIDAQRDPSRGYVGDGSALTFSFTLAAPGFLKVVDAGFPADGFEVFDGGRRLGLTSVPNAAGTPSPLNDFDLAFANAAFSSALFPLAAGSHSITGRLSSTTEAFNATLGAIQVVRSVPLPGTASLLLAALGALLVTRRAPRRAVARAAAALLGIAAMHAAAGEVTVKVIALNDFHGNLQSPGNFSGVAAGGADVLAGYVADLKSRNPNNVVVSAGDLIGASPLVSALFHDEGTIEVMNRLGLDFNAVGNHEFDRGKVELLRMQSGGCHPTDTANTCQGDKVGTPVPFEGAKFRFLAANVVDTASQRTLFAPYGIKTFQSDSGRPVRMAFIGMTLKETPTIVTPTGVAGLEFADEASTVNAVVSRLRARGVESIVVLVHQGGVQRGPGSSDINNCAGNLAGDAIAAIVRQLDDAVDLVVSGHTHQAYNCRLPNAAGRLVPVTSANAFGRVLTDIDVTIDDTTGNVTAVATRNVVVDRTNAGIVPNPTIAGIVTAYAQLASPLASQVIGSITQSLPNTAIDAACNMPAGDLIADAQLAATAPGGLGDAVIAFMNRGGVRNPGFLYNQQSGTESAGDITYGEAFTVQPFGNSLVTMTLTAQDIKNVLEQQFAGCRGQSPTDTRIMIPSAGFRYTWDGSKGCDARVSNVTLTTSDGVDTIVDESGQVASPQKTYRVTVNNFMSTGGDGFTTLLNGKNLLGGAQDIDALVAYFAGFKNPNPPYDPTVPTLGKPRIKRVAGTACPTGANVNP